MSQCHKPKTIIKYLIMNRLAGGHDDAVSRCIDEFLGFAPYWKGESECKTNRTSGEPVSWAQNQLDCEEFVTCDIVTCDIKAPN